MTMIERVAEAIERAQEHRTLSAHGIARAAIEAMREPTEEMIEKYGDLPLYEDEGPGARAAWQAMIEVALTERPKSETVPK